MHFKNNYALRGGEELLICGPMDLWTVDQWTWTCGPMWTCGPVGLWACGRVDMWNRGPEDLRASGLIYAL